MTRCLVHEPFHLADSAIIDQMVAGFGWAWDAASNAQPDAWNHGRDVCLFLVGEEFGVAGDPNDNVSRTQRLLQLYERVGPRFVNELNGAFSGVLVDLRARKTLLFNDRYGLGRIYYSRSGDKFLFSSEAKSLLAVLPSLRRIDERGLAELFSVGCVLQNRSLFSDVSLLPAGSLWTFHLDGRVDKQRYFNPEIWEQQEPLDVATYSGRLTEVFARIAPRYFRAQERVAMSLTGGLDSRMILAWARPEPAGLPCYTFAGPYRNCLDVRIAKRLATACRQLHTTIPVQSDFYEEFPALAEKTVYISDGAMDVSGAVELYVNRRARHIAPVRITGNYGSEILRSNIAFGPRQLEGSLFLPEFRALLQEATETYRSEAAGKRLSFIAFKQVPWHHYSRQSIEKSQLLPRSPFLDNELVELAFRAPAELLTSPEPMLRSIADGSPALDAFATDRALRRAPAPVATRLGRIWREFTAKAEYVYDYGMPRWLARVDRLLESLHPERLFLGHHKFYHFRIWYRAQLGGYLRSCAATGIASPCYRPDAVHSMVNEHLDGRANHTLALHRMLTVQLIERLLLRSS